MSEKIKVIIGKGAVIFPHDDPDLCPTYYDGCNCTSTSVEQMSAIANDAQLEAGNLEDEVTRLRSIIEGLECANDDCYDEIAPTKCQVCKAKQQAKTEGEGE